MRYRSKALSALGFLRGFHGRIIYNFGYARWQQLQNICEVYTAGVSSLRLDPSVSSVGSQHTATATKVLAFPMIALVTPLRLCVRIPCDALIWMSCIAAEMMPLAI